MGTDHSEQWHRVRRLLDQALDRPSGERTVFLKQVCAGDAGLREEIESLLEAYDGADAAFFETGAGPVVFFGDTPSVEGRRVGPYRIVEEIGRGGMGEVYRAERADGAFEQIVALKLLRAGYDVPALVRRFRYERQILAALEHPGIARLYDGGLTEDARPYFVMEYVEGCPIDDYCTAHRLSIEQRLKLFVDVTRAVAHAHRRLVVHRDLKPSNILVTEAGAPKLLDFGIAKLLEEEQAGATATLTRTGERLMTPEYAAPEQVRGEAITTATDVYALGAVLTESGHARQAEPLLREALHIAKATLPEGHPQIAKVQSKLDLCLTALK